MAAYLCTAGFVCALITGAPLVAWPLLVAALSADAWGYRLRARRGAQALADEPTDDAPPRHMPASPTKGQQK
jgi:hypothetical protein